MFSVFLGVVLVPKVVGEDGMVGHKHDAPDGFDFTDVASQLRTAQVQHRLVGVVDSNDEPRFAFTEGGVGFTFSRVDFGGG